MPERLSTPAARTIRGLLHDHWDETQTAGYNPRDDPEATSTGFVLTTGNYEENLPDPQVTCQNPNGENTVGGENYSGMRSDGKQNQYRRGVVQVVCWAESLPDESETYRNGWDAEETVFHLRQEVEAVMQQFDAGTGEFWQFSPTWNGRFPGQGSQPRWQTQVSVTYEYNNEPV